ncbi:MAG: ATP-binding protein [Schleiferiaceae bacterium]|nr:ATP-binding protein [Schleiferiaceae bacterium]
MVKAILDRFGGTIWVEASSPEGSEFCFTLPVKA